MHPIDIVRPQTTPPTLELDDFLDFGCPDTGSTAATYLTDQDWSPKSVQTNGTTPPNRSPYRECGPQILPRIRSQDQIMDRAPVAVLSHLGHSRTQSLPAHYASQPRVNVFQPHGAHMTACAPSQASFFDFNTPVTAAPMQTYAMYQHAGLQDRISLHQMSAPISSNRSHSRNTSASSIDAMTVGKFGYPTYRQSPTPQPQGLSCTADAMSHLAPMVMLNGNPKSYPSRVRNSISPSRSRLSVEVDVNKVQVDATADSQSTCMRAYLTARNPTPQTLQHVRVQTNPNAHWFWWDVRNVYEWSDFNVNTMLSFDVLANFLKHQVPTTSLPEPGRVNLMLDNKGQLVDLCSSHHLFKLNAALKLMQGNKERQLLARALTTNTSARQDPEIMSNICTDGGRTICGSSHVIGIVRGFEEWNSGMRGEDPIKRVEYLRGLAFLHQQMRDHGCRYGFIITEIELVCVRVGGVPDLTRPEPLFGFLELSTPIQMSTHGPAQDGNLQMTAGIALWYLHLLAGDEALPGQLHWKMEVGAPSAGTRRIHMAKDTWIGNPTAKEKRTAKNARGWIMPNELISTKERKRRRA